MPLAAPERRTRPETRRGRHQNEGRTVTNHGTSTGYRYGCRCPLCVEAKRVENAAGYQARGWNPTPEERTRRSQQSRATYRRRIERQERAATYRLALYERAVAEAQGELAELVAAQRGDDRWWVRCTTFDDAVLISFSQTEWDDPTADAALAAA